MRGRHLLAASAAVFLAAAAVAAWWWTGSGRDDRAPNHVAVAEVFRPAGQPDAAVFLVSDARGWSGADAALARDLAGAGALVVGVDLPKTLASAEAGADCIYLLGDFEAVSHRVQKEVGGSTYRDPVIAGAREGGALATALVAETPDATVGRTIAVDPTLGIALKRPLCSGAPRQLSPDGRTTVYGLEDPELPDPVTVISTAAADAAGAAHVVDLVAGGYPIERVASAATPDAALRSALLDAVGAAKAAATSDLGDLPLAVLPARPLHDTMAIVLSGDGGWRDIDKEIGGALADAGVPTIGLDSLRYFWTEKTPATIAADLQRIVDHYGKAWGVARVALVGYSFGADVLPATWAALDGGLQDRVSVVSLLGLSGTASFQFEVSGLLGLSGSSTHETLPDVRRMPADRIQCTYGADDPDTVCPKLEGTGAEVIRTAGGHHFDGDFEAIARRILARIDAAGAEARGPAPR